MLAGNSEVICDHIISPPLQMCTHDFFVSLSADSNLSLVALLTTPRTIIYRTRLSLLTTPRTIIYRTRLSLLTTPRTIIYRTRLSLLTTPRTIIYRTRLSLLTTPRTIIYRTRLSSIVLKLLLLPMSYCGALPNMSNTSRRFVGLL